MHLKEGVGVREALERLLRAAGLRATDVEAAGEVGIAEGYQLGPDDGVRVSPMPITAGERVSISYSGLLATAGAGKVYLHCGEGPGPWMNVRDIPMEKGSSGEWVAQVLAGDGGTLEFCFHDGAGHWDNNSGVNWAVTVHDGRAPH